MGCGVTVTLTPEAKLAFRNFLYKALDEVHKENNMSTENEQILGDLGLAIKKQMYYKLSSKTRNFLMGLFNEFTQETEEWYLFTAKNVKWHSWEEDERRFYHEVTELQENQEDDDGETIEAEFSDDDITFIVASYEYPDDESDDFNGSDPWELTRENTVKCRWNTL